MEETKTFFVDLTKCIDRKFKVIAPVDTTMEEVDDWVDWHRERIFNAFNKNPNISVYFPEEMLKQKRVSISVELDSKDEYIDFNRIVELKEGE